MKYLYLIVALFCFVHAVRDVMQEFGIRNFFTTFMHRGEKLTDKYNVPVAGILTIIGVLTFYLFLTQ